MQHYCPTLFNPADYFLDLLSVNVKSSSLEVDSKLRIHEAQCRRMTYKCDKCFELIQKCEQEAHDYEFHEIVSTYLPMRYECQKLIVLLTPYSWNVSTARILSARGT